MSLLKIFKHKWISILVMTLFFFWAGFFIVEFLVNQSVTTYSIELESTKISVEDITVDFFLDGLAKYDKETGKLTGYSYASVKPNDIFENNDITYQEIDGKIVISIKAKHFISSQANTISTESQERFDKVMKKVVKFHDSDAVVSSSVVDNYTNGWLIGALSGVLALCGISIFYYFYYKKNPNILEIPYDNEKIFPHPFSKNYWKKSIESLTKLKVFDMCLIAILFAFQLALKPIDIPTGFPNLTIGVTYLVFAIITMIYGPIWGLIIGLFSDILGFVIEPSATFMFGYSIQAMLTGFTYGLFFYKTDLRFGKVLLCRLVVNVFLNGIFGSILWGIYSNLSFDGTISYMLTISMPKNIIFLIPQSILLYLTFRLVVPLFERNDIVSKEVIDSSFKKKDIAQK